MIEHRSFGVIPVRRTRHGWEYFVVQHRTGHWAFPKGHQEPGESGEQTALRELAEETGIKNIMLHTPKTFVEDYTWNGQGEKNHKIVTYYLGLIGDHTIAIQAGELSDGRWIAADEVEEVLTFKEAQAIFRGAQKLLIKNPPWT